MRLNIPKRAQSTLEYSVLIFTFVAALLYAGLYLKRGMQGRAREASDDLGGQFSLQTTKYNYTYISHSNSKTVVDKDGAQNSSLADIQYQTKSGNESTANLDTESLF